MATFRPLLFISCATLLIPTAALAQAPRSAHGESPLAPILVLAAIGAAVIIAGVAVWRLYRSAYLGKPKFPPRDFPRDPPTGA